MVALNIFLIFNSHCHSLRHTFFLNNFKVSKDVRFKIDTLDLHIANNLRPSRSFKVTAFLPSKSVTKLQKIFKLSFSILYIIISIASYERFSIFVSFCLGNFPRNKIWIKFTDLRTDLSFFLVAGGSSSPLPSVCPPPS